MKNKRNTLAILSIAVMLIGGIAWAQGPGAGPEGPGIGPGGPGAGAGLMAGQGRHGRRHRPGFRLAFAIRALDLSEEQADQAREIRDRAREERRTLAEERRALRKELRTALESEAPAPETVGSIVISLHENRKQGRLLREQAMADFEAILTPEQLERLEEFRQRREARRSRFGRRPGLN